MEGFNRVEVAAKRRDVDRLMATATKHYVRQHVWLPIAVERWQQVGRPLKYFTLTTSDLFDVKVLERKGIIEKTSRGYPGVGFCESNDKEFDEISRRLQRCSWSYKGYFEKMVSEHPNFEEEFGFDVINLDFILVPFPGQESPLEGTWGAIQRLLQVQWAKQMGFDLFVTFRGSRNGTNEQGCGVMPAWRRGAWHGSVWPVRYCPAYPQATAATRLARTVPGAAFPAPPGRPAAS